VQPKDVQKDLRLVSKRFNVIAVPLIYLKFTLSPNLFVESAKPVEAKIISHVVENSRDISIYEKPNCQWHRVARLMSRCTKLQDLRYATLSCRSIFLRDGRWFHFPSGWQFPLSVEKCLQSELPHVRVHITCPEKAQDEKIVIGPNSLPKSQLVSLDLSQGTVIHPWDEGCFNDLIVSSKALRDLRLRIDFEFSPAKGKLPPITTLLLRKSSWLYTPDEVPKIWDFSNLEELTLVSVDIDRFLSSVSATMFPSLMKLNLFKRSNIRNMQCRK
jgi:hypothetical protein